MALTESPEDWPRRRRCTHGPTYSRAHWALARTASAREMDGAGASGVDQSASSVSKPSVVNALSATRRWPSAVMWIRSAAHSRQSRRAVMPHWSMTNASCRRAMVQMCAV